MLSTKRIRLIKNWSSLIFFQSRWCWIRINDSGFSLYQLSLNLWIKKWIQAQPSDHMAMMCLKAVWLNDFAVLCDITMQHIHLFTRVLPWRMLVNSDWFKCYHLGILPAPTHSCPLVKVEIEQVKGVNIFLITPLINPHK